MPTSPYRTLIHLADELRGERVLLRPYRADDAPALWQAIDASRDHIRPWLPFADRHRTVDETRDWISHRMAAWLLREDLGLSIWERGTEHFLGGIGLHPRNWDIGYFELGYWLRQSAEGHGYLSEAVRLLTDYAFDALHANRIEIGCDTRNQRSAAVAERLGFVREAHLRNHASSMDGTLRSTYIFALTPSDPRWPANR
ncbi:MAG TPA: GNAT family N-acetyltransferase [Ktedonobacterales bacterium]